VTADSREIEFKFAVDGHQAFESLLRHLKLPASLVNSGVTQTNHFFDSTSLCLRHHHFVIRLREAGGSYALTVKGERSNETSSSGALSNRIEEEVLIPRTAAEALLKGDLPPRQAISDHFADRASALRNMIDNACDDQELEHIGQFNNERIHLPPVDLAVGHASESLVFELDTSTFPGNRVEYEIEVEIEAQSDAAGIEAALIGLLHEAGIDWRTAPSKAVRFFAALENTTGEPMD
jgi:uncharacterized protein YjbK